LFCLFSVYLLIPESIFINGLHCERWSPMTFPSELVRRRLEVVTLVNHDYRYPLHKTTVFFCMFTFQDEKGSLYFSRDQKAINNSFPFKFSKTTIISKTKLVAKPPLQNQQGIKLTAIKTYPKPFHLCQRVKH